MSMSRTASSAETAHAGHARSQLARFGAVAALLAAAFVGTSPMRAASAGENKIYRDKANKFSCLIPAEWSAVPLEPGETEIVAKFSEKAAEAKGVLPNQVTVYRLGTAARAAVTGEPSLEDRLRAAMGRQANDLVELANEHFKRNEFAGSIDPAKGKPITSKDDVPGLLHVTEVQYAEKALADRYPKQFHLVATWAKPGENVQYGMWFRSEVARRKKFEPVFRAVVASFRWFDDKAKEVVTLSVLDGVNISAAKRGEIERGLVAGWNVIVSSKKNYIVIYNTVKDRNHLLAKIIAERIELIREQVYEKQFPPKKKIEDVCIVRVCGGRAEYMAYGGPGGSAGYWSPYHEELVFYDASPAKAADDDTIAVLYHEAFHQYIHYSAGRVAPHSWFNEGHGDYYAGAKLVAGKFVIKPFTWRMGIIKNALRAGASPVKDAGFDRTKHGYTPLDRLTAFSQGEYYSYPDVCYAQGWSLIYFLREIVPKNAKWNAKWGTILETYFSVLQNAAAKQAARPRFPFPKPDEPGMGEPGMEGDSAPDEPAMGDTPPDAPGMGDPGMGEPGMGGGEPEADEPDPDAGAGFFAPPTEEGEGGDLQKALEAAFKAFKEADWKELEDAWRKSILELNG